jgi:hypothetical protein
MKIPTPGALKCYLCGGETHGLTPKPGVVNICGVCFLKIEPLILWAKLTALQKQKTGNDPSNGGVNSLHPLNGE